jgi:acetate kinase
MRDLHKDDKNPQSKLAIDMFCDRLVHYIGAYTAELNGVNAIIFTGGIGENAYYIRKQVLDNFSYLGLKLDTNSNKKNNFLISAKDSKIDVFVIATNEELQIATDTKETLKL